MIRTTGVLLAAGVLLALSARAGLAAPECVTPRATAVPGKGLERVWISVFERPDPKASPIWIKIAAPLSLVVSKHQGDFLQLTATESAESPFKPGVVLGWVHAADVQQEPYRNCAF